MRADRLLALLIELQLHPIITADALARRFDVSRRTIYRDVDALGSIGVPVYADRGPGGGIRLVDGYRTRLTGMSQSEVEALLLIGLVAPATDLGLAEHAASARLKLLAALPAPLTEAALRVGERFHLDPVDWYRRAQRPPLLPQVAQSVWQGKRLSMHYQSWKGSAMRTVEPLGLVMKAGTWYLVARSSARLGVFRVENIMSASMLDVAVTLPRDFDLAAHWAYEVTRFETSLRTAEATLRVAPDALPRASELHSDIAEAIFAATPDPDGYRVVKVPIEGVDHAAARLLAFSDRIEVLEPIQLRKRIASLAKRALAQYS